MAKSAPQPDVLVLGIHPSAYLAAALLGQTPSLRVIHALIPGEELIDRLVLINPALFDLHPILSTLKRKLDLSPVYGLKFLADDPAVSNLQVAKTIGAYVGSLKQVHAAIRKLAESAKVKAHEPRRIQIRGLDEKGLAIELDDAVIHPKLLILGGELPADQKRMLGLPASWESGVLHRYTCVQLKGTKWCDLGSKPIVPMSLDLKGTLNWAWLFQGAGQAQLAVDQPLNSVQRHPPRAMLQHWIDVLTAHGVLKAGASPINLDRAFSLDLPLAGALSQEGVANRTLLIGPAGGFYTACCEDLYPNCWSAVHAVEVAKKALKERHLQDALQPYRQRWGATLGDYLRGPQQNLRFLLPLVYRNPTMTARLTEAILFGKSVVR